MKKRIIVMVLMLFAAFGFVACNATISVNTTTTTLSDTSSGTTSSGTTTTTTTKVTAPEQAAAPTGLSITGKILSWTAVPNVTQYAVYVNGTQQATVSAVNYDFSAVTGDRLIFQVVALGAQGVLDSPKSASLAYVNDPTQEIADITAALEDSPMAGAPDGFVEELVRKGVISEEVDDDMTALQTFLDAVEAAEGNLVAINAALTVFLNSLSNYEAYISAFMILLPPQIEMQVESIEDQIEYRQDCILDYQDQITYFESEKTNPYSWYTPEECENYIEMFNKYLAEEEGYIDSLEAQIQQVHDMAQAVEDHGDEMTLAVTSVVSYLMDLQSHVTIALLTNLQGLIESDDRPTSAEIIAVKDEAVNILLDNLPSQEDLTLFYDLAYTMYAAMTGTTNDLGVYANEMAMQTRLTIQFGLEFLLSLDNAFVDETFRIIDESRSEAEIQVELGIHAFQAVQSFVSSQDVLIASIEAVFTEAQRQEIYESGIDSALEMIAISGMPPEQLEAMTALYEELDYDTMKFFADLIADQGGKLFDYLSTTDGEVARAIVQFASIHYGYGMDDYVNFYTNEGYENYTVFNHGKMIAAFTMIDEVVKVIDATLATITETQVSSFVDILASMVPVLVFNYIGDMGEIDEADITAVINSLKTALDNQDANALALFSQFIDYMIAEDIAGDLTALAEELHAYNTTQFGDDYIFESAYDPNYGRCANLLLGANRLNAFMTPARRSLVDGIVNEAFAFMRTPEFLELNGITVEEVNSMESQVETTISDVLAQVAVVSGYDYHALTEEQLQEIEHLTLLLSGSLPE